MATTRIILAIILAIILGATGCADLPTKGDVQSGFDEATSAVVEQIGELNKLLLTALDTERRNTASQRERAELAEARVAELEAELGKPSLKLQLKLEEYQQKVESLEGKSCYSLLQSFVNGFEEEGQQISEMLTSRQMDEEECSRDIQQLQDSISTQVEEERAWMDARGYIQVPLYLQLGVTWCSSSPGTYDALYWATRFRGEEVGSSFLVGEIGSDILEISVGEDMVCITPLDRGYTRIRIVDPEGREDYLMVIVHDAQEACQN